MSRWPGVRNRTISWVCLCGVLVVACDHATTREAAFETLDDARASGAVTNGYLPDHLPASARDIRQRHRERAGDAWGRFEFDEQDRGWWEDRCRPAAPGRVPMPGSETRGTGWWAEMLRSDAESAAEQFELFECGPTDGRASRGRRYLAVHRRLPTAFYWTARPGTSPGD